MRIPSGGLKGNSLEFRHFEGGIPGSGDVIVAVVAAAVALTSLAALIAPGSASGLLPPAAR